MCISNSYSFYLLGQNLIIFFFLLCSYSPFFQFFLIPIHLAFSFDLLVFCAYLVFHYLEKLRFVIYLICLEYLKYLGLFSLFPFNNFFYLLVLFFLSLSLLSVSCASLFPFHWFSLCTAVVYFPILVLP